MSSDHATNEMITVRITKASHTRLCRLRLRLAQQLEAGIYVGPRPDDTFPSLASTVEWMLWTYRDKVTDEPVGNGGCNGGRRIQRKVVGDE
jgi:hypothetical protein